MKIKYKILLLLIGIGSIFLIIFLNRKSSVSTLKSLDPADTCKASCMAVATAATAACTAEFEVFSEWCENISAIAEDVCDDVCDAPICVNDSDCASSNDLFGNPYNKCVTHGKNKRCMRTYTETECENVSTGVCDPDLGSAFYKATNSCGCKPSDKTCAEVWNTQASECVLNTDQTCRAFYAAGGDLPAGCPQVDAAACVADSNNFWCHNDNKCHEHDSAAGASGGACATRSHCAAANKSGCDCDDPTDITCFPEQKCANDGKFWCYKDGNCYNHGEGSPCSGTSNCVSDNGGQDSPSCLYSNIKADSDGIIGSLDILGMTDCCPTASVNAGVATCCGMGATYPKYDKMWDVPFNSAWYGCKNECQTAGGGHQ